jgi:hypothetical protein
MSKGLAANVKVAAGVDRGVQAVLEKGRQKLLGIHDVKIARLPDDQSQRGPAYRAGTQGHRLIGRGPASGVRLCVVDRQRDRDFAVLYFDGDTPGALHVDRPLALSCFGMTRFLSCRMGRCPQSGLKWTSIQDQFE